MLLNLQNMATTVKLMPIDELSKNSAKLGTFAAYVTVPSLREYTARAKVYHKFQCVFVGKQSVETEGSEVYCMAVRK